ncbi:ABC transporter permease subunit [Vibrio sp. SCSIO 43133]|uniref:PstC family ABC transporter permease n=1 Tax=Vibrio sp. SCSIO 43133 TaxID=2802577 RepID=UPI0020751C1D|nr:ABC transporter permease subunit [Vibrio sp. SCSIO 43133]USE03335.1 ABC transporter permease subunit [Vibrio sp. SCSIO 43133]
MRHLVAPERVLLSLVMVVLVLMSLLFGFLIWFALPVVTDPSVAVFSLQWQPDQGHYGIFSMVFGSGVLAITASLVAFPFALGIASFCQYSRYQPIAIWIRRLVRLMAGIPTVVYGLAAVFLLVPLLRETFRSGSGFSLLAVMLMMVLLILPVMIMMLDSRFQALTQQLRLTSCSLGMTDSQMIAHVIAPNSMHAVASAALLGFNRAIGDTLLPLMLAGNAPQITGSILDSVRTLTAHIGLVLATENSSAMYNSLFAAGLLLLTISVCVTVLIRKLTHSTDGGING